MQIALLKAIKLHKELEPILLEVSLHEDQEVWMANRTVLLPKRIIDSSANGNEDIEDNDNTLVKKMQNIYKQAKVNY